jgi:hypothetical protein
LRRAALLHCALTAPNPDFIYSEIWSASALTADR